MDPIFGIVGIKLFPDDKAVAKTIFCNIPTVTVGIISCFIIFIRGKSFYNKEIWKYALKFNLPLVPHYLSNIILSQSDRIMISKILNEAYAGMYSIAYMISSLINGIFTAINSAWTPFVYKNLKANRIKKISENTNILIDVISVICVGVVLIAPEVIKILAPSEYYSAVWAVPPVCIGMYFSFIYTLFGKLEFYHKKNLFIMVATTAAAILNIILNLIFIPIFGYIAAGYTTAIGYFALAIGHYIFMKKIDKRKIYNIKFIIKISIVVVISIFSIIFLYDYVLIRYGIILVALIILALNYKQLLSFAKRYIKEIRGE